MKIQMGLIVNGKEVESKVVDSELRAFKFERDMPAKHSVQFTNTPYAIKRVYLDRI